MHFTDEWKLSLRSDDALMLEQDTVAEFCGDISRTLLIPQHGKKTCFVDYNVLC